MADMPPVENHPKFPQWLAAHRRVTEAAEHLGLLRSRPIDDPERIAAQVALRLAQISMDRIQLD